MKTTLKLFLIVITLLTTINILAQTPAGVTTPVKSTLNQKGLTFSLRVGHDFPFYKNNTPHIKYKGGLDIGTSIDYYWSWLGAGIDYDYINNYTENTFPTTNVYRFGGTLIKKFNLSEGNIYRNFIGIGPNFKWQNNSGKFSAELNTRLGVGNVIGGQVILSDALGGSGIINYHAGYDGKYRFATKLQTRFNYYLTDWLAINTGVYYIQHYKYQEKTIPGTSSYASYYDFTSPHKDIVELSTNTPLKRENPCNCNIYSFGVFAGVTLKIPTKFTKKAKKCNQCETYSLAVTARDKFTKKILPNTDVAIKNIKGEIVETGTTNNYGVVVFNGITPDNYTIEGVLHDVNLDINTTRKEEFKPKTVLQKEITYANEDFILKGNAVVCNTDEGIPGVKVRLLNKAEGVQKNAVTNGKGVYIFHVKQNKTYTISGKKDKYFSQTETINTSNFDRNTTLFVKLEVCLEKADCGKALKLQNIHYDLDKYFIRNDAKPELNRLVQFMKDNPTLKVEVSSHTDSRGSDSHNMTLSQNRAIAAVNYLISQGIAKERLSSVGYGETKLLNECGNDVPCSKAKHQLNRRTEMKVICPDEK